MIWLLIATVAEAAVIIALAICLAEERDYARILEQILYDGEDDAS